MKFLSQQWQLALPRRPGWRKLRLALLAILVLAALAGAYLKFLEPRQPVDPVERFLAAHWAQPIAPQGDPPPGFSAIEASLAPETCAACHVAQYTDWSTSLHSQAMGPGVRWQLLVMNQAEANDCLRCHAPLAEQKALVALEHGWANAPRTPVPAYVSPDLHRRGNTCASCHVRKHQRFGPLAPSRNPKLHGGFSAQPAFSDSRFCAPCHQFPPGARSLAGKLIENTYEEWRDSPAARQGATCQSCHMPDRRHIWRGIHDAETVRKGLRRELEVKRLANGKLAVLATITAPGVGHYFPTYVVPKVTVSLHLRTPAGTWELARHVIGRTVSVDMTREWSDTRIPPGGKSEVSAEVTVTALPGGGQIELHTEIAPAEHYIRMFQSMLEQNPGMDAAAQSLLREALRQARNTAYRLDDLRTKVPVGLDDAQRAVAN
ncbi:MAG: multiheme c-type cytochrome [Sterolibacterium sp.]